MDAKWLGDLECGDQSQPRCVLLFSGKRKCGKDYITDLLVERIGSDHALIMKISAPIKSYWAETRGLDLQQLMSDGEYKEQYRQDMINWSESMRAQDPGYFCKKAVAMHNGSLKPVWIISDIRRRTDIEWFRSQYRGVRTVRVFADEKVRAERGFIFTKGVDDIASECDLDNIIDWDWKIKNNGNAEELDHQVLPIVKYATDVLQ